MPDPRDELIDRLALELGRIKGTLTVPAMEFVPAMRDAWKIADAAHGEAVHYRLARRAQAEGATR